MSRGLSASELEQFRDLLQRFAEHELDQFENWRFDTRYGPVYVSWARKLLAGWPAEAFTPMSRPTAYDTGRFAHVTDVGSAATRDDVLRVISEMGQDLADKGAREWENPNLERFLEALGGVLAGLDGLYANRGETLPTQPDWGLLAAALVAATGYE